MSSSFRYWYVSMYDKEPIFKDNLLVWNNKYYLIGAEHKEFSADKMLDEDYYILTLAAIARELNIAKSILLIYLSPPGFR